MHLRNGWLGNRSKEMAKKKNETHTHGEKILDTVPGGAAEMKVISTTQCKGWLRRQVKVDRQSGEKRGLADGIGPAGFRAQGFQA